MLVWSLEIGRKNAKTAAELSAGLGVDEIFIHEEVLKEIRQGVFIVYENVSGVNWYFIPKTLKDLKNFCSVLIDQDLFDILPLFVNEINRQEALLKGGRNG